MWLRGCVQVYQDTPCLLSCPRVLITSTGLAEQHQHRRTGCFRLSGTLFGDTMVGLLLPLQHLNPRRHGQVHYQNMNRQYLTPDSMSTPFSIHWLGLQPTVKLSTFCEKSC